MQKQNTRQTTGDAEVSVSEEQERIRQMENLLQGTDREDFLREIAELKEETSARLQEAQSSLGDLNMLVTSTEHTVAKKELSVRENAERDKESEMIDTIFDDA